MNLLHSSVVRGEIDNRVKGVVRGQIWLAGQNKPLVLKLHGNPCRDLVGRVVRFANASTPRKGAETIDPDQSGSCGEMTTLSTGTAPKDDQAPKFQRLRLEWFSEKNGRVVLESTGFELDISPPAWELTESEADQEDLRRSAARTEFTVTSTEGPDSHGNLPDPPEESDPFIDQILRINDLKHQVEQLSEGALIESGPATVPLDVEEQFWKNVVAYESASMITHRELLARDGVKPTPSKEIPDTGLPAELWKLIRALANRNIFLDGTDHLSDRALYELLVGTLLEEETENLPSTSGWRSHVTIYEYGVPGREDGQTTYLRYYADQGDREDWARAYPDMELPPSEELPFDRDSKLPKADDPQGED
jgi:hypothetical protein